MVLQNIYIIKGVCLYDTDLKVTEEERKGFCEGDIEFPYALKEYGDNILKFPSCSSELENKVWFIANIVACIPREMFPTCTKKKNKCKRPDICDKCFNQTVIGSMNYEFLMNNVVECEFSIKHDPRAFKLKYDYSDEELEAVAKKFEKQVKYYYLPDDCGCCS